MGSNAAGGSRSGVDTLRITRLGRDARNATNLHTTLGSIRLPAAHSPVVVLEWSRLLGRRTNGNRDDAHQAASITRPAGSECQLDTLSAAELVHRLFKREGWL